MKKNRKAQLQIRTTKEIKSQIKKHVEVENENNLYTTASEADIVERILTVYYSNKVLIDLLPKLSDEQKTLLEKDLKDFIK